MILVSLLLAHSHVRLFVVLYCRKRYAYNVAPHPITQQEGKFTLRIFSQKDVRVEMVPETHTVVSRSHL